jgi:hypothetical protein
MIFDPNAKNMAPMYLGTAHNGRFSYRRYAMERPYATVGEGGVEYSGPPIADALGSIRKIGVFGPRAEELLLQFATPGYEVVGVSSETAWGKSSTELVKLVNDPTVVALVAAGREPAHLAEQIAAKAFLPVVAISSDRTLTSANIPWIFRLNPDTSVADAIRCITHAVAYAGPNRGRIREFLASGSGIFPFASNGERQ